MGLFPCVSHFIYTHTLHNPHTLSYIERERERGEEGEKENEEERAWREFKPKPKKAIRSTIKLKER